MGRLARSLVFMLFGMVLAVGPAGLAFAQDELPPLAELSSVRLDYVSTFNGDPGIVCQEEWASGTRYHGTCQELVDAQYPEIGIDLVAGRVTEYIYYDGVFYTRVNDSTTWTSFRDATYDPSLTINEALFSIYLFPGPSMVISDLGPADVGGASATQYQFWSLDEDLNALSGGQFVYDIFVSAQGYVLKDQISERGSFPMGDGELALIWTYSNFNQEVSVSPPAESVQATGAGRGQQAPALIVQR